ncbi:helix-turn-helix domain-containing protein [Cohnella hongkongensis]|uniref:Helix-turn-helix domain-containing protein n=1 Tax=Cohnella hongkongensis TaxID=178337 RepID=A0ABV9FIC0_9BACL
MILVEDEMLVRMGLLNSVNWAAYQMEVAADLTNGREAWNYCEREGFPDLIITDIRMPEMDGMELIVRVREQNKNTRIVVLSCLEEFELVRKAMSLGVSNYILKLTMAKDEIGSVLEGVKAELDSRRTALPQGPWIPANLELIKERYVKDFLFYGIYSAEEFEKFAVQCGFRLSPVRMAVCTMEVDRYALLQERFRDEQGHLIKLTLLNILQEIAASFRGEVIYLDETRYLILLSFEDLLSEQGIRQEINACTSSIQEAIRSCYGSSVSFGISSVQSGYRTLRKLYFESLRALDKKIATGPGFCHRLEDPLDFSRALPHMETLRDAASLRQLLTPSKEKEFDDYIERLNAALPGGRKAVLVVLYSFVQWVCATVYGHPEREKSLLLQMTDVLNQCETIPELLEQTHEFVCRIVERSRMTITVKSVISKAIQYMKDHYHEEISLQQVADHVNLSLGYLSHLFKKELDITFVEYLTQYRIERAKELLSQTRMKSYDIAVKVGFSPEYTYFSKVFKKMTGLGPNEYRRKALAEDRGGS